MHQNSKVKSKRYQGDKIDFIIPFLINQNTQQIPRHQSTAIKVKQSIDHATCGYTDLDQIAKIYNIPKKKSKSTRKYVSKASTKPVQQTSFNDLKRFASNFSQRMPVSTQTPKRFTKTRSQICHQVASSVSPSRLSGSSKKSVNKYKVEAISTQQTSMKGIRFREKTQKKIFIDTPVCDQSKVQQFQGEVRKKVKQWKQKRQWDRMRSVNVDAIITRKCKSFYQVICQYRRRMLLPQTAKIFVFDSKDLWLKRVLVDRGWIENNNADTKVFHLSWTNKIIKEPLYQQQKVNHYPNSYSLTTKVGLFNLLAKYDLNQLQPKTFDLTTERSLFVMQFAKRQFLNRLQSFLLKFQFEDLPENFQKQQLLQNFTTTYKEVKQKSINQLSNVLKTCIDILSNKLKANSTMIDFQALYKQIKSKVKLTEIQQQSIRLLSDFYNFARKQIGRQKGNFWISKSKISSKGVGISVHNDIQSTLKYDNRLIQKYIEKPLLFDHSPFKGRKFDLRIWVLLVGSQPEIYYHQQFYGRTCFDAYSLDSQNIKNQSIHLTNYHQNRKSFTKNQQSHQSIIFPQDLFSSVQKKYKIHYKDKFYNDIERILSKMTNIFKLQIINKQTSNYFQLFGCDILLDQALHMYLLEINMSARCKQRHPQLTEMLDKMGHGMLNILEKQEVGLKQLHGWIRVK